MITFFIDFLILYLLLQEQLSSKRHSSTTTIMFPKTTSTGKITNLINEIRNV